VWLDEHKKPQTWSPSSLTLAALVDGSVAEDDNFYYMFNASGSAVEFLLPPAQHAKTWHRVVDTADESPDDIVGVPPYATLSTQRSYLSAASSFVFLIAN
jgi:pullulanase/glycogen debranching enzyme